MAQSRGGIDSAAPVPCMLSSPDAKGLGSVGCEFPSPPPKDLVISGLKVPSSHYPIELLSSLPVPPLTTLLGIVVPIWCRGSNLTKIK